MLGLIPISGDAISSLGGATPTHYEAAVTFSGTGALVAAGTIHYLSTINYAGTGAFTLAGALSLLGSVDYSGTGTFQANAATLQAGEVSFSGSGAFSAAGRVTLEGRLSVFGTGTFRVAGYGDVPGYLPGTREYQTEFEDPLTVIQGSVSTERRPDALTFDYLTSFSMGPVAIADVTGGITDRAWYVRCDNATKTVYIASSNSAKTAWLTEQILFQFTGADINELDLAFEQAARAVVCAERTVSGTKEVWLYWFDPDVSAFVFEKFDDGRTPRVVLDDTEDTSGSDVQLMYFKPGSGLLRREQRDAYAVAYTTPVGDDDNFYLEELAISRSRRLVAIYSYHDTVRGRWFLLRLQSALYPVYPRDEFTVSLDITAGELIVSVILHTLFDIDEFDTSLDILVTSALVSIVIEHTLFDIDEFDTSLDILATSTLEVVLIIHELYDKDTFDASIDIVAAGSALDDVVIEHSLFDKDTFDAAVDILAAGSALEVV